MLYLFLPQGAAAQERRVYHEVWAYDEEGNHVGTQITDCDGKVSSFGTYTENLKTVDRYQCDPAWTERVAPWADGWGSTNSYGPQSICYTECISYPADGNWCSAGSPCCSTYCY